MQLSCSQLGRYQLLHQIGNEEAETIYLAQDVQLPRQVAVKVMRADDEAQESNSEVTARREQLFKREMQIIAQLDHPHILSIFDFGTENSDQASYAYLVMHYCPAGSLADWLSQARDNERLPLSEISHLLSQAAEALHYAHERGVIHQDVKSSNLLLRADSSQSGVLPDLLLADFGMTRLFAATSSQGLSQTPYVRSTYLSLAPEQWDGKAVPASDQYALAILAFRLLTGQFPFQGSLSQVIHHHYKTPPPPPSSLNPQLDSSIDKIIQRALAKEPAERFPSIQDFAHAFASLLRPADDQIRHVSRALPAQTLSESADTPPPEPSPTELPVSTEAPALIETNEEIQVDKANLALVSTIPPTTPAVAGTLYPDFGISKPAPPLPILRLDPPSPQLSSPPVQRRDHFTMRQSLPIVLLVLVILASSGIFFRNVMARANGSAYGPSNHGARTNAATQSGQTLAGSGGAQPISTPGTSTPISIAGSTPTPVPTSPSGAIPPAGATPPAPGTTPAPASTPQPGSTPQPTATPKTTYPHVPFAVSSSYGRTSGAINFYNRSVQIAGTVSANQASDCARVDFFVYADYGKLLLSSAQTPTNNQVSGGYTCKSFSFNFTLSANVAGGASYVKIDLYLSKNGLVASNNCYR